MNTIKDLLDDEQLTSYERTEYPFNLSILHNALKQKLQEDPEFEVFVPLVYYKYFPMVRCRDHALRPYSYFISNKGTVLSLRKANPKVMTVSSGEPYPTFSAIVGGVKETILLHRALACNFIPVPEVLQSHHPKNLQANHLDGIKTNYLLGNIEWSTPAGNHEHAKETGLLMGQGFGLDNRYTIPVKGVVLKGPLAGYKFILRGGTEITSFGFNPGNVNSCCTGRAKTHRSCSWSYASPEEVDTLTVGIDKEMQKHL